MKSEKPEVMSRKSGDGSRTSEVKRRLRLRLVCLPFSVFCLLVFHPVLVHAAAWSPETEIRGHLLERYPWAEVTISDVRLSAAPPAEKPSAVVVEKTPPGRAVFRLDFKNKSSITATALVKTFDRVFLSRAAFRRDYVFRRDDIYPTLMESGRIPKGAVRDESGIIGKPLLRAVVPNAPITDALVSETPVVKRGSKVTLSVEAAGFSIKTVGETKNDAAVGQHVKAVNLLSKKIVAGMLIDANTVRVEY